MYFIDIYDCSPPWTTLLGKKVLKQIQTDGQADTQSLVRCLSCKTGSLPRDLSRQTGGLSCSLETEGKPP